MNDKQIILIFESLEILFRKIELRTSKDRAMLQAIQQQIEELKDENN